MLDLSRGYSMYAAVRRGAAHRGRSPCTPLEDSGQNADGPSSPHLDTLPLSPRWPRGAEFMGSNGLAGETRASNLDPPPSLENTTVERCISPEHREEGRSEQYFLIFSKQF